jgi:catechol 2,3-dioxygenase-like lactoylglutathione lyase family enzyme
MAADILAAVPHFGEIALFTDDVPAARAFYEALLGLSPEAEWPGGAIYAVGTVKLLVHERANPPENGPPNEDHFALEVGDLDGSFAQLQASGVEFLVEPRDFPWGRSAYLRDPDGRLVELQGPRS